MAEKLIDMALAALAERFEKKYEKRAWKELITKAEKKGALVEEDSTPLSGVKSTAYETFNLPGSKGS